MHAIRRSETGFCATVGMSGTETVPSYRTARPLARPIATLLLTSDRKD